MNLCGAGPLGNLEVDIASEVTTRVWPINGEGYPKPLEIGDRIIKVAVGLGIGQYMECR